MKDRFPIYLIIFAAVYIGLYMWELKKEIAYLNHHIDKQEEEVLKHRELIDAQRDYIIILELDYKSPLYNSPHPLYKDPI